MSNAGPANEDRDEWEFIPFNCVDRLESIAIQEDAILRRQDFVYNEYSDFFKWYPKTKKIISFNQFINSRRFKTINPELYNGKNASNMNILFNNIKMMPKTKGVILEIYNKEKELLWIPIQEAMKTYQKIKDKLSFNMPDSVYIQTACSNSALVDDVLINSQHELIMEKIKSLKKGGKKRTNKYKKSRRQRKTKKHNKRSRYVRA
jgi:hypothetical protein